MDPPYSERYYHFLHFLQMLDWTPEDMRSLPVYITETNQDQPWLDINSGWVYEAYHVIDQWNKTHAQPIRCLALYRYPRYDDRYIEGKDHVIADYEEAIEEGWTWETTSPPEPPNGGSDVLLNASFEEPFISYANEVKVAEHWTPVYSEGALSPIPGAHPMKTSRPEYKPIFANQHAYRVLDGATSQCWFVRWKQMDAGVTQRLEGLVVGKDAKFTVNAQAWCSEGGDPLVSDVELYMQVGLDMKPEGDPNMWSERVVWSSWIYINATYQPISIAAVTSSPNVDLFVRCASKWPVSHMDAYIDRATFEIEGGGGTPGTGYTEEQIRQFAREEAAKGFAAGLAALQ
jgi:hypothetical protein